MEQHRTPIYLSELDILKRFSDMEKHFPRCTGKRYFPSLNFYLNFYEDPMGSLKVEADNMLSFVGMGAYNSRIHVENLQGAAGYIKLTDDMWADITLDLDVYKDVDKVMATLAHEICHKLLFKNGIYFREPTEIENEIYADLATFYVGFGYFTMRGYLFSKKTRTIETVGDKIKKNITITNKHYGYLTPESYAIAYNIINVINRNIDSGDYKDLPDHAKENLQIVMKKSVLKELTNISTKNISEKFLKASTDIAKVKLILDVLSQTLNDNAKLIQKKFKELSEGFYSFKDEKYFDWNIMNLAYQYALNVEEKGHKTIIELKDSLLVALSALTRGGLSKKTSQTDYTPLPKCPICENVINKELESKLYHFICPHCKTHFVLDYDSGKLIIDVTQKTNQMYKEQKALLEKPKLEDDIQKLQLRIDAIERKWWYKMFHKL
ncbi:MAG: hypothetical protein K5895_07590 [Lachnospiraceae bacterium]|nr:hypothetical protein [Lachnospiraceae bacterium]